MKFAERLAEVEQAIEKACLHSGRRRSEVRLIAVSKQQPLNIIEEAYSAGIRDFGENYVQDLVERKQSLSKYPDIRWHLIGRLQSNKVRPAISNAAFFHALDSIELLKEISRRLRMHGKESDKPWPVFIQVNIDREPAKAGVDPDAVGGLVEEIKRHPEVSLQGLMCVPMLKANPEEMRPAFQKLYQMAQQFSSDSRLKLSIGMSDDFEIAIEEGADWIRVGRRLFGERSNKT